MWGKIFNDNFITNLPMSLMLNSIFSKVTRKSIVSPVTQCSWEYWNSYSQTTLARATFVFMFSFNMYRLNEREQIFSESLSPVPQQPADWDTGSHMSNSATQFCSVLTGTIISTQWALVRRKKTSTNEMTCSVLPSPMLCARIQPRPLLILYRSSDSITLS